MDECPFCVMPAKAVNDGIGRRNDGNPADENKVINN